MTDETYDLDRKKTKDDETSIQHYCKFLRWEFIEPTYTLIPKRGGIIPGIACLYLAASFGDKFFIFLLAEIYLRLVSRYMMGTIKALRRVEVNKPPRMTTAIGLWISLPGRSPETARGTRARAEVKAVIRIGLRRSAEPCIRLSLSVLPSKRRSL